MRFDESNRALARGPIHARYLNAYARLARVPLHTRFANDSGTRPKQADGGLVLRARGRVSLVACGLLPYCTYPDSSIG